MMADESKQEHHDTASGGITGVMEVDLGGNDTERSSEVVVVVVDDGTEMDRLTVTRLQEIEAIVKSEQPLTGGLLQPIVEAIQHQYEHATERDGFLQSLHQLGNQYDAIRLVRGDGNCYYRAFLYRLLEHLLQEGGQSQQQSPVAGGGGDEGQRILQWLKVDSWKQVLQAGYQEIALEAFYESVVELMERVVLKSIDLQTLHEELNVENGSSDYSTWYMRVLTATFIRNDPDRFLPFIAAMSTDDQYTYMDVEQFCKREVEPTGRECDQPQVLALAESFGVQVTIQYLTHGVLTNHIFGPDNAKTKLCFLYRPGHYDILYEKKIAAAADGS